MDINVKMLKEKLYKVASALFRISETCVEASKQHISEEKALDKIRDYLNDAEMWSKFKVDQLIEDCMEPKVYNWFEDCGKKYLKINDIDYPSCCDGCSNNPKNGGSGICNCALPYMQDPIKYTIQPGDSCMANNTGGYVYTTSTKLPDASTQTVNVAEAVERINKYLRK